MIQIALLALVFAAPLAAVDEQEVAAPVVIPATAVACPDCGK